MAWYCHRGHTSALSPLSVADKLKSISNTLGARENSSSLLRSPPQTPHLAVLSEAIEDQRPEHFHTRRRLLRLTWSILLKSTTHHFPTALAPQRTPFSRPKPRNAKASCALTVTHADSGGATAWVCESTSSKCFLSVDRFRGRYSECIYTLDLGGTIVIACSAESSVPAFALCLEGSQRGCRSLEDSHLVSKSTWWTCTNALPSPLFPPHVTLVNPTSFLATTPLLLPSK